MKHIVLVVVLLFPDILKPFTALTFYVNCVCVRVYVYFTGDWTQGVLPLSYTPDFLFLF